MKMNLKNKKILTKICAFGIGASLMAAPLTADAYVCKPTYQGEVMNCTGTVSGTIGKNKKSACVGSTLYEADYYNVVSVFGYNTNGTLLSSAYAQQASLQARAVTSTQKGVTKYKLTHSILNSSKVPVKSVKKTIS